MIIREIRPDLEKQKALRRSARRDLTRHFNENGSDLQGYAMISWNSRGIAVSNFYTETGPVSLSLLSCYVHDVLNRHIVQSLVEQK